MRVRTNHGGSMQEIEEANDMLEKIRVRDIVGKRDEIWSINADDTADIAALKLKNYKIRTLGVLNKKGELVGVVGNNDLARKVVAQSLMPSEVKVSEIMSPVLYTVRLDTPFIECLELMEKFHVAHLVVLDENGKYHGMISWHDLQKRLVKELKSQLELLQEYAFGPTCTIEQRI
jgi:CBS-domain-containing membrane protein